MHEGEASIGMVAFAKWVREMELYYLTLGRKCEMLKETTEMYWNSLKKYSLASLSYALKQHQQHEKKGSYLPSISDLCGYLRSSGDSARSSNVCCVCNSNNVDISVWNGDHAKWYCEKHYLSHIAINEMIARYGYELCKENGVAAWMAGPVADKKVLITAQ